MRRKPIRALVLAIVAFALVTTALPAEAAPAPDDDCIRPRVALAAPVGTTSCPGVRPGGLLIIPSLGYGCTMGFLYSDALGRSYMTTAGHCAATETDATGEPLPYQKVWPEGVGPVATTGTGKPFGRFVFGSYGGNYDIGVILVTKGVKVTAAMCHFGGPTSASTSNTNDIVAIEHFGNSLGFGDVFPARSGWMPGMTDKYSAYAYLPSFKGDSGGPVISAGGGKAIGMVTAIAIGGQFPYGGIVITRLGPQMSYAQKMLKRTLKLRTAPHSSSALF